MDEDGDILVKGSVLHGRLAQAGRLMRLFGKTVLDVIYPPSCLACRAAIAEPDRLCPQCWTKMRFIERPYCERLGTPFAQDLGAGLLSPQALAYPPVYNRARAVAHFEDGPARHLVHRLKYGDRMELAKPMGHWMARAGAEVLATADVLVPVPLHPKKLGARRFNQAMVLAESISHHCAVPVASTALSRVKVTQPQVGLSRAQRATNVQGAFRVLPDAAFEVSGRNVVLVDDVLTSGATLNAAARALLRGGATSVDVLVFARVVTGL
eukprot:gene14322-14445_t